MNFDTPFGIVRVPPRGGRVGIALSGGVDSAILLYIMAMTLNLRPRVMFVTDANSSEKAARDVLTWINNWVGINLELEFVPRITEGSWLRHDINKLADHVSVLYTGVTGNPPVDFGHTPPNRPAYRPNPRFVTPFLPLDKRASVWLYDELKVPELMNVTHSCTTSLEVPCGKCFQCMEKAWAIEEVKRVR